MFKNILVLLLFFILTSSFIKLADEKLLSDLTRTHQDDLLFLKLKTFTEHKDEYDAVFIGSSLVLNQVDVIQFDRNVQSKLPGFKSYNLGFPQASYHDTLFVLDYLNNLKTKKLKYVFVEPLNVSFLKEENITSKRVIKTHTFYHTSEAVINILHSDVYNNPSFKIREVIKHLKAFSYNIFSIGVVYYWHEYIRNHSTTAENSLQIVKNQRGFEPLPQDETRLQNSKRWNFLENKSLYLAALERRKKGLFPQAKKFDQQKKVINKFINLTQKLNAEPVFILMPLLSDTYRLGALYTRLTEIFPQTHFMNYDDPFKYPELYEVKNKWDYLHLNPAGAQILTKLLSDDFSKFKFHDN